MANTSTPAAPAVTPADFSLQDAVNYLQQLVHGPEYGTPAPAQPGALDCHQAWEHVDALHEAAQALQHMAEGIDLLCTLMTEGGPTAGWQRKQALAINGVLRPIEAALRQHQHALCTALGYALE